MDDREKLRRIAELVEDYKDLDVDYETVKCNLGHESFFAVASDMTDALLTIQKNVEVL